MEAVIRFKNGDEITAEVNGNSYITAKKPSFPKDLTGITITSGDNVTEIEEGMLVECAVCPGDTRYWFTLCEKPLDVKQAERIAELEEKNAFLEGCIMEMSEEVYK